MLYFIRTRAFKFFALYAIATQLLLSFFACSATRQLWEMVDIQFFRTCNSLVDGHPLQALFWALANIKITDLYGALFFVSSFILYIFEAPDKTQRKIRIGYLIYTLIWFEITILFTKEILTPICEYLRISRHSPTVVLTEVIRLSTFCPWAKIKDISHFCFPSDHAVIVVQWALFFTFFAGLRRGIFLGTFSLIFLMPRLISGAHWLSDILVGSVAIVFFAFGLATQTPIYDIAMRWIQTKIMRVHDWNRF